MIRPFLFVRTRGMIGDMMRKFALPFAAALTLAACSGASETETGGLTPSEDQALNDAAEMLDQADAAVIEGATKPSN